MYMGIKFEFGGFDLVSPFEWAEGLRLNSILVHHF